jgi:hypothetical protein
MPPSGSPPPADSPGAVFRPGKKYILCDLCVSVAKKTPSNFQIPRLIGYAGAAFLSLQ